ncbi:neuroblastoma-amplified sequence-like [Chelonus insularis]|uniref:neuroblastoma-amplified sequence-like n=1 Tax=Chelonus insularis TaxID=460826 RepID=UPI00158A91A3|nr:neuroblastoma-amplified sequence-like [Chelonus insularis]
MDNKQVDIDNDSILYELIEYFVKKQEPELVRYNNGSAILSTTGTIKNAIKYLNNSYSLPESISQQVSLTLPWKFAIGDNGRLLAILYENIIEIRRSKDEFSTVIGKASVPKDAFPQWRKVTWSPDGSILVLASSSGHLSFYNSLGNNVFNINPKTEAQNPDILEAGDAIASLIFKNLQVKSDIWKYEILVTTYSGLLKSYLISGTYGYEAKHEFSFGNFYRKGVNAFAYDHKHNLYIVAGNNITQTYSSVASSTGLTSWRPLNDYPYYKLSFTFEENTTPHTLSLWNLIPKFRMPEEAVIFRISVSPSCNHLVCLHTDGAISLWNLPNLQLKKKWKLNEQPNYDAHNPLHCSKYRKLPVGFSEYHPIDIGWWSDHAIIIARYSGAISVCSMVDLKNLLGTSPEFLYGQPQISEFYSDKGFLCLDCEMTIVTKKRNREPSVDEQSSEVSDSEQEEDELEPSTLMNYTTNLIRNALYSITDIETFQPKRKKTKILQRTYRILGLKSTTPEELYSRKIDIENYEEALSLANSYNLDTDLVYQTQWRKSQFSLQAIQEHLSKVRNRSWVLNECIMRVPKTLEAARELLNFGLKKTSLETFLEMNENDNEQIVINENSDDLSYLTDVSVNLKYMQKVNEAIKNVDFNSLSKSQKKLLSNRKHLLDHLDKLKTYEIIIHDPEKYDKESYEKFRQLTILENAIQFARDCNHRAVNILFTYHRPKLMPHWLIIISCFPETLNPCEYKKLLPECDDQGQLFLLYEKELRPKDWVEKHEFESFISTNNDNDSHFIYESDPSLSVYKTTIITMDLLTKWYKSRAYEIERNSWIVENALELIKIARMHKIMGLDNLLLVLETLDDIVYNVGIENMSLAQFEKLSELEKIKLLMSTSTEKNFVTNIKRFVLAFIYRKQKYLNGDLDKKLLKSYLLNLSENDLKLPLTFFKNLKQDIELLNMIEDIILLAIDCIYSCTNPNMYEKAKAIFDTLPKPQPMKNASGEIYDPVGELERELECLKILNKYNVTCTIKYIHDNKSNSEETKLLLQQMSNSLNDISPPPNQEAWAEVLNDMCELQEFILNCLTVEDCFEICVMSRLASGIKINIQNCTTLIETKKTENSLVKVSYDKAVKLIVAASRDYFNNSKSHNDSSMELAKSCLHLIEDDNPLIEEENNLINSLQILNEFNISILPLQVRLCQDRLKLIESCLKNKKGAYKRQQRLLTLASYLNIEGNNVRNREGKVLDLVGQKAFEVKDYEYCASICQKIIDSSYFQAWKIIQKLGFCDDYNDLTFKQKALAFTLTYGPNELLESTLKQLHLLEIQDLNKSLENWLAIYESKNAEKNDDDSDDEFTDAMTTPQSEIKEFVPKILETSTELVKNSAQLVKQSTLEILKNVSSHSFWKTATNINTKNNQESSIDNTNNSEVLKRDEVQSFPFFYISLHKNCNTSRFDTKYNDYSMPDINNIKLKICQTLLRINALSETASYGLNVSDINHFLVQLATYIFSDDWLLGISYLLSLQHNYFSHAEDVFENLPHTELYILTALYFYSIKLYMKVCTGASSLYFYTPIDIIQKMVSKIGDEVIMTEEHNEIVNNEELNNIQKYLKDWYNKLMQENQVENIPEELNDANDKEELILHEEISENCDKNPISNLDETEASNLYANDAFKMKTEEFSQEEEGWDDNWSNFSDSNDEKIENNEKKNSVPSCVSLKESCSSINVDSIDRNVEDGNTKESNIISTNESIKTDSSETADDSTEEKRFAIFNHSFSKMVTKDDYSRIKEILKSWPKFTNPEFINDNHPIFCMVKSVNRFIPRNTNSKNEIAILQEYKELLMDQKFDSEAYSKFITEFETECSFEDSIFLRLCVDDSKLHEEAIKLIKSRENIELSLPTLEELFFRNLIIYFPPHHPIYNKTLEEMFLNHTLDEIKGNIKILIDKLIEEKHIPYAMGLWNQLKTIPLALSTFENCYQLFLSK